MTLAVDVTHRLGQFTLQARFASKGKLTAFFGPSGSGKTSLLNMIAGILRPDQGSIVLNDRILVDTAKGIVVPMHRRRIGYVFQEARLFPHLTVRQNLFYGRWFTPREERTMPSEQVFDLLNLGHLLDRRPGALSGGEKQRVAIGRALLASPHLLLMDEPLASLDETLKEEILPFIERLRDEAEVPIVYVSHSLAEVARLATTVVMIKDGRVAGVGVPGEVLGRRDLLTAEAAGEAGALVEAVVSGHDAGFGLTAIRCDGGTLYAPHLTLPVGAPVRLRIRARDVMIATSLPSALSALNVLPGHVVGVELVGDGLGEVTLDCNGIRLTARLTLKSIDTLSLVPERHVYAVIKAVSFDRDTLSRAPAPSAMRNADSTVV
jgi:molybdate transport system ATP-binding protein